LTGGHAISLAYGIGIPNVPLIVTDSVGLCCGLVTWITAVRLADATFCVRRFMTPHRGLLWPHVAVTPG
jgi:hypothetical protein